MHTGTVYAEFRLGHKSGMQSVPAGDRLDRQLKGHDVIGSGQRLVIAEVNLVLGRRHLMVGSLDLEPHFLQCQHHIPPCIFSEIHRPQIEIAGLLMGDRRRHRIFIRIKKKKLTLRPDLESIAQLLCLFHRFF